MEKEWQFFLASALYGGELLFVYDMIRSFRNVWKHGKILIAAEDLLFWLAAGIFLFTQLYLWNNGIIRWYFLMGIFLGMLLYTAAFSHLVIKIVSFFLKRLKMFFSWVNIILERVLSLFRGVIGNQFSKILGIKNGENGKAEKEESTCEQNDGTE